MNVKPYIKCKLQRIIGTELTIPYQKKVAAGNTCKDCNTILNINVLLMSHSFR